MKKHIIRFFSIVLFAIAVTAGNERAAAQDVQVSFQVFYDNLAPYGQWVYDPDFGNVWVPNEAGDFRPYGSRGRWVMTDYGNTWVSDDPWGWAVYHYGRWTYNPYYGWIWVPGYEWAPAWVSWRYGGGYAGWAPLAPGINVGMTYYAPDSWWVFMGPHYMYQPNCIRYWYGPSYNANYIHHTTIINNYYIDNSTRVRYNYGPRAEVIQQTTGRPVKVYQVSHRNRPGAPSVGRNSVSLYRPMVNSASVREARPSRVIQAPRSIGRGTQPVQQMDNRQPAFRQDISRLQQQEGGRGRGDDSRGGRIQQNERTQPGRSEYDNTRGQREDNRPQPGRFNADDGGRGRTQEQPQPRGRTEQDNRPASQQRNDSRPQPGRFDNTPSREQQPGRFDNAPSREPQPGRFDNTPSREPQRGRFDNQPSRETPQRETRPQPQPRREDRQQPDRSGDRQPGRPAPERRQYDPRMDNRPAGREPQRQQPQQPAQREPQQGPRPQGGRR